MTKKLGVLVLIAVITVVSVACSFTYVSWVEQDQQNGGELLPPTPACCYYQQ